MDTIQLIAIIVAAAIGFIVIASFLAGYILYHTVFKRQTLSLFTTSGNVIMGDAKVIMPYFIENGKILRTVPRETVTVTSARGYRLVGYFLRAKNSNRTAICMHGYRSQAYGDFAAIAQSYLREGYNVLLVNHEGHGDSDGKEIGFGINDRQNTAMWVDAVNERIPNGEIVLHGVSMGAATCLMSSDIPYENVKAIVADCGYASVDGEFRHVRKSVMPFVPHFPIVNIAEMFAKIRLGFDFSSVSSVKSVKNSRYPLLIIHGAEDKFVPTAMATEIYEAANCPKDLLIVPNAAHAASHCMHPDMYETKLFGFLNQYLGGAENGI